MEAWRPLFSPRCNIEVDKGDTEAMSHNEVMGSDSRAERKREKRRLVNAPLAPAAVLMNRKRALRAATTSYCAMLYETAYFESAYFEAKRRTFKRNAERLKSRVAGGVLPVIGGEPAYRIKIRNPASAVTHELCFGPHTTYGTFFHMVRTLFGKPTGMTTVSMRLWHEADAEHLIEGRTNARLPRELHNKTLCIVFYSTQP